MKSTFKIILSILLAGLSCLFWFFFHVQYYKRLDYFNEQGRCFDVESGMVYHEQSGMIYLLLAVITSAILGCFIGFYNK